MSPPPRYTEQQRTAIVVAVLDRGLSVAEARRQAAAGELEGVEAFDMSKDAAYNCVAKARLDQAETHAKADPRNSANTYAREVLAALQPSNHALLAQAKAGRDVDTKLRERARLLREFVALQGATEKKTQHPGSARKTQDDQAKAAPVDLKGLLDTQDTEQPEARDMSPARSRTSTGAALAGSSAPAYSP